MAFDLSSLSDISALIRGQNAGNGIREVSIDSIQPDPNQPRKTFDQESLEELAQSIQSIGIIQPPVVRTHAGAYMLISGERRWRAARHLGWETLDVIVRDDLSARAQLVENIQREALSAWEIYRVVSAELAAGTTHAELAQSLGKSRPWVTAYAAVENMPEPIVAALREGRVTGITALTHLHRLHGEMPAAAAELLKAPKQISRSMVERAKKGASSSRAAEDSTSSPTSMPDCKNVIGEHLPERIRASAEANGERVWLTAAGQSPIRASTSMPIRIRARYENASWEVAYDCQREVDGVPSVRIDGDEGALRFAPLGALRLESIEWL